MTLLPMRSIDQWWASGRLPCGQGFHSEEKIKKREEMHALSFHKNICIYMIDLLLLIDYESSKRKSSWLFR